MERNIFSERRLIFENGGPSESSVEKSDTNTHEKVREDTTQKLHDLADGMHQSQEELPPEFSYKDLDEKEKETYDKLPESYKGKYLEMVQNERVKEAARHEEVTASIEYGDMHYREIEKEFKEVLPAVVEHSKDIALLFENIFEGKNTEVPEHIWNQVDKIFDNVPRSEKIKEWNREVVEQNRYAHLVSYLLQDFRNSDEAARLETIYNQLDKEGRLTIENNLRRAVDNKNVYECMFKTGMKPYIFSPEKDPANTTKIRMLDGKEWYRTVYDKNNNRILYQGVNSPDSSQYNYEGNYSNAYGDNERVYYIQNYFKNLQPNFRYRQFSEDGTEIELDFFKTYLGQKGKEFYYHVKFLDGKGRIDATAYRVPLDDEQIDELKKFFRWERDQDSR